jgi:hypothetical protein
MNGVSVPAYPGLPVKRASDVPSRGALAYPYFPVVGCDVMTASRSGWFESTIPAQMHHHLENEPHQRSASPDPTQQEQ